MTGRIIPTAEPFYFPGNDIGCLLVHGFTGAPKEMHWMGEYLAEQGYTVLGIRLAGHATKPEDMLRTHWQDWLVSVEDGYCLLNGITREVVIVGLSMGGTLSLLFASQFPVTGVIAMSTPYQLPPDPRLHFLRWLHWLMPTAPKGEESDWHDPEAEKDHVAYPAYPTRSLLELKYLLAEMRAALPEVTAPTLLMHSRQDGGVNTDNMPKIYVRLGSEDKEMLWIENSGHVIVRDAAREQVFRAANEFICRVSADQD
ncbi:MAG: alpha/beta fold hydrolase [Chloroflexota bacterium]|nr:alpha/beta fold hydrolase [Chloroflexota bacterium]